MRARSFTSTRGRRSLRLLTGFALVASAAAGAPADEILVRDRPLATDVHVVGLEGAGLRYLLTTGREVLRPLRDIDYLQIDGWATFNRAERERRDGAPRQAVLTYEQAMQEVDARRAVEPQAAPSLTDTERRLLARARLLLAHDAVGRFDLAVEQYLALLPEMPEALEALRPRHLPTARSTFLRTARESITEALRGIEDPAVHESLTQWMAGWPDRAGTGDGAPPDRTAERPRPAGATAEAPGVTPIRASLENIHALVEAGRFPEALERISPLQGPSAGLLRAELYYWEGRAHRGMAGQGDGGSAAVSRRRAGLAFMRVVIHFPEHAFAAESLYHAAVICRDDGLAEVARRLEAELTARYPVTSPWVQRVRRGEGQPAMRR